MLKKIFFYILLFFSINNSLFFLPPYNYFPLKIKRQQTLQQICLLKQNKLYFGVSKNICPHFPTLSPSLLSGGQPASSMTP